MQVVENEVERKKVDGKTERIFKKETKSSRGEHTLRQTATLAAADRENRTSAGPSPSAGRAR